MFVKFELALAGGPGPLMLNCAHHAVRHPKLYSKMVRSEPVLVSVQERASK
jgi:hypothetical protein